ncbi:hypothetical protein [Streptomyces niveus]|uniref:hypothetical protein n=1 Tax=Streptomyces niveus TaxID=193462 RepID=UPI0003C5C5A7|nr:hypothetical protein [Streptomyces niveus]EST25733.1 hypothetical protein M877_21360 [Streptomyces niveus NCIMB 11891]
MRSRPTPGGGFADERNTFEDHFRTAAFAAAIGGMGALLLGTGGFRLWRRGNTDAG